MVIFTAIATFIAGLLLVCSVPAFLFGFAWYITRDESNDSGGSAPTRLPNSYGRGRPGRF